jgi:hypothetical protein
MFSAYVRKNDKERKGKGFEPHVGKDHRGGKATGIPQKVL